jgi:alkaline phosphatase D
VWEAVLATEPDLFILMGDNVYADTTDPQQRRAAYPSAQW